MFRPRRSAIALRHVAFEDLSLSASIMEREGWNVSFCEAVVDDLSHTGIRNAEHALALQFHMEAEPCPLEQWYVGHAVELAAANVSIIELRITTAKLANTLATQADRVFADWLRQIEQHDVSTWSSINAR